MTTVSDIKYRLTKELAEAGIEASECLKESELILEDVLGLSLAQQILNIDQHIEEEKLRSIIIILDKRKKRIPLQYCLGHAYFMGLKISVSPGVFIPRTDTEILVAKAFEFLTKNQIEKPLLLEIGTGSGAISIALLKMLPNLKATAADISPEAIVVSSENATKHGVLNRLELICSDWFSLLHLASKQFDAIISNPPYIPWAKRDELDKEVLNEPEEALFASDEDGLTFYRQLAERGFLYLKPSGFILFEIGDGQAQVVKEMLLDWHWQSVSIHNDINGLPRAISAFKIK